MKRCLAALLLLSSVAFALRASARKQDPEPKYASGDKCTITVESTLDLDIATTDGEGTKSRGLHIARNEKYSQELVEVSGGKPRLLRVKCEDATYQRSSSTENITKVTSPISGRSFYVTLGDGASVKTLSGDPAPSEADAVGGWEDLVKLLPAKGTAVGGTWNVDARDAGAVVWLGRMSNVKGSLACTYAKNEGGKATVTFTGSMTGADKDGFAAKFEITSGEYVFNTGTGKSASFSMAGKLEMVKKMTEKFLKPDSSEEETRDTGEIKATSKKLEAKITIE